MRKSLTIALGFLLLASFGFGQTVISVVSSSVPNDAGTVAVPINLANSEDVGGIQFSVKDVPNVLGVVTVTPFGRTAADEFDDADNNGIWTPDEDLTVDHNNNGVWDDAFAVEFTNRDSSVSILIFDNSGRAIPAGNEPICQIWYTIPVWLQDDIVALDFHEILNAETPFLLVVSDPEGAAMTALWQNGMLTRGGIEFSLEQGPNLSPGLQGTIIVNMENAVPVKGFQFNLIDNPDRFTVVGVNALGRASEFNMVGNEVEGQSMVLGIHFDGDQIPAGGGPILEVVVDVSADGAIDEEVPVAISQLIVAAEGGLPLPSNGIGATMTLVVGVEDQAAIPTEFELAQNYPNPFNPSTTIGFGIPEASDVQLAIYNLLGQEIRSLANNNFQPGSYSVVWDGNDNAGNQVVSGIYLYRLTTSTGFVQTNKLVKLK